MLSIKLVTLLCLDQVRGKYFDKILLFCYLAKSQGLILVTIWRCNAEPKIFSSQYILNFKIALEAKFLNNAKKNKRLKSVRRDFRFYLDVKNSLQVVSNDS